MRLPDPSDPEPPDAEQAEEGPTASASPQDALPEDVPSENDATAPIRVHALLVLLACMLLLLYVAGIAGVSGVRAAQAGRLLSASVHVLVAATASVSSLVLFAQPRRFGLVALVGLSLALWHGLYLALSAPGTFSLDAPFMWLYVWPAAAALVLLPIALRTWIPS